MKTALLVVNPTAGAGRGIERAAVLEQELRRRGFVTRIVRTAPMRDASLYGELGSADVAIAIGGDGTLNRVAEAVLRIEDHAKRPVVGFFACGTGNAAARAFGLPTEPRDIAALACAASARTIDVGLVSREGKQIAVFLLWVGAGVDASLIETVAESRSAHRGWRIALEYVRQASRLLFTYPFHGIHLTSAAVTGEFGAVMVANVGQLAIGSVTSSADPADGQMNVVATRHRNRAAWILAVALGGLNLYDRCPRVSRTLATALRLESSVRVAVHADGEPIGALPVEIKVSPSAIRLLAAPGRSA